MMNADVEPPSTDPLTTGHTALSRGAWQEARAAFEAALAWEETPESLEGLGMASWWLDDAAVTFDARERAYRWYRERGDRRGAARVASALSMDYFSFRGEYAIASGWIQRAHRLLEGLEPGPELGWLAISEAHMALMADHNPTAAQKHCAKVVSLGRSLGDIDLEMLALAYEGLALVSQGKISEGMRRLDEATMAAVAGEMTDIDATCTACCCLIYACERARDYERAAQWCERLKELSQRWSYRMMFSICRTHYAGVLMWRGAWAEAEAELQATIYALETTRPAQAAEGLVRLAELRCQQGRFEEAAALFERAESHPFRMLARDLCLLGRAAMALEQDDPETAVDLAGRFLRAIPEEDRMERVAGLELLVRAWVALGDRVRAKDALAELCSLAGNIATQPMQGSARFAEGLVAAAVEDYDAAKQCFEDAVELWTRSGIPFETARARIELANVLAELGRADAAEREARAALEALQKIGAAREAERAAALLRQLQAPKRGRASESNTFSRLTSRELEVLRLVAQGLSNKEIATKLVLSEHTVHRHIANILTKLDLPSRAAAVAYAAWHNLL